MALTNGTILENRYRIDRLLGQGGFGAVYQGYDLRLQNSVAVKENFFNTPDARKQFEKEALILARLTHPNLPRVIDHFSAGGAQYLVMDYVEGENLKEIVENCGIIAEAQALAWIEQICSALEYLHNQQPPVIHRDIKPDNIKITPDGRAVLVDFGIAKVGTATMLTSTGARAVTPGYSPPEQYGAGGTDARSDIYSVAATLYTMLTGETPPESVLLSIGAAQLSPPHQFNPQVSPILDAAIIHAMDTSPTNRPQNILEFKKSWRGAPLPSAPTSSARLPRWVLPVVGIGIVGLIIAAAVIGFMNNGRVTPTSTPHSTAPLPTLTMPATATPVVGAETIVTTTPRIVVVTNTPSPVVNIPSPTATLPPDTATPVPTDPPAPAFSPTPRIPGLVLDFEQMGAWGIGAEKNGTFTQTTAQVHNGNYAGKLDYAFHTESNDYVVFMQTYPLPESPNLLKMWVYGDGNGHYLNAWIKDSAGQVWQSTFGKVSHTGWQQMEAFIATGQAWPWGHIQGHDNGAVDYPISFYALVLDDAPDSYVGDGTIFLDDLIAEEGVPVPTPTLVPVPDETTAPIIDKTKINVTALQGRIVYDPTRPGHQYPDVWLMNANGTGERILAEDAGWPALRPDGNRVMYKRYSSDKQKLFRADLDAGGNLSYETALTEFVEDTMPFWSPDGQMIAFASQRDVSHRWEIYTMTADGHNQTPIVIYGKMPTWIPGQLIYSGCLPQDPGRCGLVASNQQGAGARLIVDNTNDMLATSSDGQWMAFMSLREGNWEIYKVPLGGGTPQRLTDHPANDGLPAWSPDGEYIAFVSNRDGNWAIYVMYPDGGAVTKIIDLQGGYPQWPNGRLHWARFE